MNGWARVPRWLIKVEGLTLTDVRLAWSFYGYASRRNYRAWPSVESLIEELGVSRSAIGRSKTTLARAGVLCFRRDYQKGKVHSVWMAVKKPFDFAVSTLGPEFEEYRAIMAGKKTARLMRPAAPHWRNGLMRPATPHSMRPATPHEKPTFFAKSDVKIMGFSSRAASQQTIRTDQQQMVRQKDDAQSRENEGSNDGTAPGERKDSSMLDEQGAVEKTRRAPPTGRRADAAPSVSLSDFTETKKKKKGRALSEGTPGQRLLDAFCVAYRERFGIAYTPSWGRDLKLAKEMATSYPLDFIPAMVKLYLADKDPYVAKEGFPFSLFRHRVNQYAFQARRATKGRSGHKSEGATIGQRFLVEDNAQETVHRVFTENGWEFETVKKPQPKKPEPTIMSDEEEFD